MALQSPFRLTRIWLNLLGSTAATPPTAVITRTVKPWASSLQSIASGDSSVVLRLWPEHPSPWSLLLFHWTQSLPSLGLPNHSDFSRSPRLMPDLTSSSQPGPMATSVVLSTQCRLPHYLGLLLGNSHPYIQFTPLSVFSASRLKSLPKSILSCHASDSAFTMSVSPAASTLLSNLWPLGDSLACTVPPVPRIPNPHFLWWDYGSFSMTPITDPLQQSLFLILYSS